MGHVRPWSTHVSSLEGQRRMKEWNSLIDEYIRETFDLRPTWDIEIEAKVDSRGGPLYKKCEVEGCSKVGGRDVEKMKCCSGYKLVCNLTAGVLDYL